MTLKADWFTNLSSSDHDPFANGMSFESPVITIESSEEEIMARLTDLVRREGRLDSVGVTCPLKDMAEASCSACPVSHLGDSDSRLSALCRIGQEQEQACTMLHAKRLGV